MSLLLIYVYFTHKTIIEDSLSKRSSLYENKLSIPSGGLRPFLQWLTLWCKKGPSLIQPSIALDERQQAKLH